MRKQSGITLTSALVWMIALAFIGLFAVKLVPSYIEYFAVKKILEPFLPYPIVERNSEGQYSFNYDRPQSIGKLKNIGSSKMTPPV